MAEVPKLNLLILGDSQVGKTALMFRYVEDRFETKVTTNVGVAFLAKTVEIDGSQVKVQVWDTAGQERFASVTSSFFRAAHGIIIAFDVTNEKTLTSVQRWIQLARENKPDVPLVVLGNKADLADQRKVTPEQAQSVCGELKMSYYEASALTGDGVQTAFNQFVKRMYTERPVKPTGRQAATTSTGNGRLSSTNVTLSPTAPAAGQGKKGMCAL